jgi:hypothetical protein
MRFVAEHTNRVAPEFFGDIRRATPLVGGVEEPITSASKALGNAANAAGVTSLAVGSACLGFLVGNNAGGGN